MRGRLIRLISGENRDVTYSLMNQVVVSGANFLMMLMVARILGVDGFGKFAFLWSLIMLVIMFQKALIIDPLMSIAVTKSALKKRVYLIYTNYMQIVFGIVSAAFVCFLALFVDYFSAQLEFSIKEVFCLALVSFAYPFLNYARRHMYLSVKRGFVPL